MSSRRGFTLIELLVVLVIASILLGVGVPSLRQLILDNRLIAHLHHFRSTLFLARSEAAVRGSPVVICKSVTGRSCEREGGWERGWLVFVDPNANEDCRDADADGRCDDDGGEIIRVFGGFDNTPTTLRATGNPGRRVAFNPQGFSSGYPGTFTICDERGLEYARGIVLSLTGRFRSATRHDNLRCPAP